MKNEVLLPPYPLLSLNWTTDMTPRHIDIEEIILELWDYCMELEDQYYINNSEEVLSKFAVAITMVQFWEDVLLSMGGHNVFRIYF